MCGTPDSKTPRSDKDITGQVYLMQIVVGEKNTTQRLHIVDSIEYFVQFRDANGSPLGYPLPSLVQKNN
jgi:hypothetical protein